MAPSSTPSTVPQKNNFKHIRHSHLLPVLQAIDSHLPKEHQLADTNESDGDDRNYVGLGSYAISMAFL
jgi:hypothetical protein